MSTTRKTAESIAFGNRLREARLNSNYPVRADLAEKAGMFLPDVLSRRARAINTTPAQYSKEFYG